MTRTERLLRLARLRGDRAAVAIVEGRRSYPARITDLANVPDRDYTAAWLKSISAPTETELRALWGDR